MRSAAVLAALVVLSAGQASAQGAAAADKAADKNVTSRSMIIGEIVDNAVRNAQVPNVRDPFSRTVSLAQPGEIVSYLIAVHAERQGYRALLDAMEARVDKQVGSTPDSSGSTSLTMKGLVPEILGAAVEKGALNAEQKGTTVTFRATPSGIVKALQGQGLLETYADYSQRTASRFASRFSAAASFDTSLGNDSNTFTASGQQLTGWSARYVVINHRDPASPEYNALWADLSRQSTAYLNATQAITDALTGDAAFKAWDDALVARVRREVEIPLATSHDMPEAKAKFTAILQQDLGALEKLPDMPAGVIKALDVYVAQLTTVQKGIDGIYAFAAKGQSVTLDWSTARDPKLPDLYTATLIWEAGLGASRKNDLTVNAVVSFYRDVPVSATQQFKSVDVSMQFDHPLGSVWTLPAVILSLSGRYSYLPRDTVASSDTAAGGAPALQGSIGVAQLKLTIPVKGSGLKIPLSVTASNRTELIKEKEVRASFGVTYDLDPLIGGLLGK